MEQKIDDLTNIPNEFQGALRFGYLDFDLLTYEINVIHLFYGVSFPTPYI